MGLVEVFLLRHPEAVPSSSRSTQCRHVTFPSDLCAEHTLGPSGPGKPGESPEAIQLGAWPGWAT